MSTFLRETLGVADSGVFWDVGNFKLFQSTQNNVILFISKIPELVRDEKKRPQLAVTNYIEQQEDRSVKISGGAASFSITSAVQYDPQALKQLEDSWRAAVGERGANARFVPLNTQKGKVRLTIPEADGTVRTKHNETDVGTPGGTLSFLVDLSEKGAQAWAQGIKNGTRIPGVVEYRYEYLRSLPPVGATVKIHGSRVFSHLSTALNVSVNGFWYGGSAKLEAEWNNMTRNGAIEIVFHGAGLPPELEQLRQDLTKTVAEQGRRILFDQIFAPMPQVDPAQPGDTSGIFGGANFALKWRRDSDTINLEQTIKFEGLTWLESSMDADLGYLFRDVDPSCLTEVQLQQAFDASLVIDSDPMLSNLALSVNFSEGHSPEAPVFSADGGTTRYVAFSQRPNEVTISYKGKIDYAPPRWPIIPIEGSAKVKDGGNQIVIKTSQWVGRHEIYMFVRDGDRILPPTELGEEDYLILNVSYAGRHLPAPVRDTAHLTGLSMIEFFYPLSPKGERGVAKFSAFGVIGGKLVRAPEQIIPPDETAVFVLASRDGNIQLVTQETVLPESDVLAERLRAAQARPVIALPAVESGAAGAANGDGRREFSGMVVAVEYTPGGPALWVETAQGRQRVRLRREQEVGPFDDEPRNVRVRLDETGTYAEGLLVELNGSK